MEFLTGTGGAPSGKSGSRINHAFGRMISNRLDPWAPFFSAVTSKKSLK
jgi:hypothetical protein